MAEQTLQQQLAAALQQLSKQHEKQLQGVLEQVQSLSEQVMTLSKNRAGSQSSSENPYLESVISLANIQHQTSACAGCKKAHWYTGEHKPKQVEFLCRESGFNTPVGACSFFENL
jgi:hypothetical protein